MGADMSKHLLSLSDLNAAAPGVLSVVFGPDGEFILAPMFRPPLWHTDGYWIWKYVEDELPGMPVALDLRIPTVAARLLALLRRLNYQRRSTRAAIRSSTNRHLSSTWTESNAADLGVVVLALAPQIAALTDSP